MQESDIASPDKLFGCKEGCYLSLEGTDPDIDPVTLIHMRNCRNYGKSFEVLLDKLRRP